jgi:quaternary ammonium compound-resistance protein SugE
MAWLWLAVAGAAEIAWMIGLKLSDGFTRLGWSAATLAAMAISIVFLSLAIRTMPMGTAYAVWTGIGAAGIALIGIAFFGEPRTLLRLVCIALILAGIVGLKLASP